MIGDLRNELKNMNIGRKSKDERQTSNIERPTVVRLWRRIRILSRQKRMSFSDESENLATCRKIWIPAFARMTSRRISYSKSEATSFFNVDPCLSHQGGEGIHIPLGRTYANYDRNERGRFL